MEILFDRLQEALFILHASELSVKKPEVYLELLKEDYRQSPEAYSGFLMDLSAGYDLSLARLTRSEGSVRITMDIQISRGSYELSFMESKQSLAFRLGRKYVVRAGSFEKTA